MNAKTSNVGKTSVLLHGGRECVVTRTYEPGLLELLRAEI